MNAEFQSLPAEVRNWIGRQLFEHVPNNIAVIDRDFSVLIANKNFREVFGDPRGKRCYEVYKGRKSVCEQCMAALTFEDGKVRVNDEVGTDRNGRPAHYVVHIAPVYDELGRVSSVIEMSYDVTETKSLQKEYNILFERVPCFVSVINRDLRIVRANDFVRRTFGEKSGEHCYEVYKNRTERCSDCPALKTFADGKSNRSEHEGIDRNGRKTHFVVVTAPLSRSGGEFSHVIEMSTDVTDIHKLSDELQKEHEFLRVLTDNAMDALVAVDEKGVVNVFNRAAEVLFNTKASAVIGRARGEQFLPREFIDTIGSGCGTLALPETVVTAAQGEEIPVRFSGSVLCNGERVMGGAGFLQDLRPLKQLEQEKIESERLAAVGQTVAQLAHGIKNILTGLQGGMYVVKSGMRAGSEDRTAKGWEMLERNVGRITDMVKEFLSFSKGHTPLVKPVDPNAVAEDVQKLYADSAQRMGVNLCFEAHEGIRKAPMDREDIHTCLANLVSNAMDACQASENNNCSVTLRVDEVDDVVIFEVRDTGCGMDYEIKNKVFTTFFTTKGLGGTGLGLMVTRKIVQQHGGKISVDSTPGQGSVFRLEFPRKKLPKPDSGQVTDG